MLNLIISKKMKINTKWGNLFYSLGKNKERESVISSVKKDIE